MKTLQAKGEEKPISKPSEIVQKEADIERLQLETSFLEQQKASLAQDFKSELKLIADDIKQTSHEVTMLDLQLREKEQELRLSELKLKELRKQMPHNRLRPIQSKRTMPLEPVSSVYLTALPPEIRVLTNQDRFARARRFSR